MKLNTFFEKLFYQWPAKVLCLVGAILLYVFINLYGLERHEVTVPIQYTFPSNLINSQALVQKAVLHFKGSKEKIEYFRSLKLDESDFSVTVEIPANASVGDSNYTVKTRILSGGKDLSELGFESTEPSSININLVKASFKQVPVVPDFQGNLKDGYSLNNYSIIPSDVSIKGTQEQLDLIDSIQTEPINWDGKDQTFTQNTLLSVRDRSRVKSTTPLVLVRVEIGKNVQTIDYKDLPIEVVDLDPKFKIINSLPLGSLTFKERNQTKSNNNPREPHLYIIASKFTKAGTYTANVLVDYDEDYELVLRTPLTVMIQLEDSQ